MSQNFYNRDVLLRAGFVFRCFVRIAATSLKKGTLKERILERGKVVPMISCATEKGKRGVASREIASLSIIRFSKLGRERVENGK